MRFKKALDLWTQALDLGSQFGAVGLPRHSSARLPANSNRSSGVASADPQRLLRGSTAITQRSSVLPKTIANMYGVTDPALQRAYSGHTAVIQRSKRDHLAPGHRTPLHKPRISAGIGSAFSGSTPAQRAKIQALLDFTPQASLFSRARYPRISRNRWLESSVEDFPSVHLRGTRLSAIDDDKALNAKIQAFKEQFAIEINHLRVAVAGKFKVEVIRVDACGSPKVIVKTPQGKTISRPDGSTLREQGIRGGAMELRRAQELSEKIKNIHKHCFSLSKEVSDAHSKLVHVIGTHRRRGSSELIFTNKVFAQISALRVAPVEDKEVGLYSPLPHLQLECFRLHSSLMARAIASHLTLINQLYNRRNNLKRRGFGTTRPAAFALSTSHTTARGLPLVEWRLSMRLVDGRFIYRDTVQRSTFSKVRGKVLSPQIEPVALPDGSLSMPAVAYASLLHMGDEYHAVEAARFAFTKVVSSVAASAKLLFASGSNCAVRMADWSFSDALVLPSHLQIPVQAAPR